MIRLIIKIFRKLNDKFINPFIIKSYLHFHKVVFVNDLRIYGWPFIINKGTMQIGENVIINSRYRNNPIGGNTFSSFWVKKGGLIQIGNRCRISNSAFVAATRITIGNNVYIGGDCKLYDTDFHSINSDQRMMKIEPGIKSKDIIIGDNVFIGGGSIILKGVEIGDNAVIGAGSVVSKSIPHNEIWGGNPVKFLKKK